MVRSPRVGRPAGPAPLAKLSPGDEPVGNGVGDRGGAAEQEVVGRLDGPDLDRGPALDGHAGSVGRGELIVLRRQHQHGHRRRRDRRHLRQRGSDGDDAANAFVGRRERHDGAERVADDDVAVPAGPSIEFVDRGDQVVLLADATVELPAEVEPQRRETGRREAPIHRVDDRVEPVAAVAGVRVAHGHAGRSVDRAVGRDCQIGRKLVPVGRREQYGLHRVDGTLAIVSDVDQKLPIKMLNDRLLVKLSKDDGERKTGGGILIPATAQMSKRLVWAEVVALGPNVRSAEIGDNVLFSPDDRYEVEVGGDDYIMLRERDLHAVAAKRIEASTGLYL